MPRIPAPTRPIPPTWILGPVPEFAEADAVEAAPEAEEADDRTEDAALVALE